MAATLFPNTRTNWEALRSFLFAPLYGEEEAFDRITFVGTVCERVYAFVCVVLVIYVRRSRE